MGIVEGDLSPNIAKKTVLAEEERVLATIERANQSMEVIREKFASYRGPCHRCEFGSYEIGAKKALCRHPGVSKVDIDAHTGKERWDYPWQSNQRTKGALCGKEGILFVPASRGVLARRAALRIAKPVFKWSFRVAVMTSLILSVAIWGKAAAFIIFAFALLFLIGVLLYTA